MDYSASHFIYHLVISPVHLKSIYTLNLVDNKLIKLVDSNLIYNTLNQFQERVNMSSDKKKREYTELQQKFLDCVLDDNHKGDIRKAMMTAGYSPTMPTSAVIKSLSEELIELAKNVVAANSIKAVFSTLDILDNPASLGASNKLKAAQTILDRAGIKKEESQDINLKVPQGGLVILPAKEVEAEIETAETDEKGRSTTE